MKLGTAAGWGMAGMLAFALVAQAQEPACGADDVSCWYLVGGAGEAPRRVAGLPTGRSWTAPARLDLGRKRR
jgi:hypothetical protein